MWGGKRIGAGRKGVPSKSMWVPLGVLDQVQGIINGFRESKGVILNNTDNQDDLKPESVILNNTDNQDDLKPESVILNNTDNQDDSSKLQSFSTEQLQKELGLRGCGVSVEQDVGQAYLINKKVNNILAKYTGRSREAMWKDAEALTMAIKEHYDAECKKRVDEELKIGWERVQADRKELADLKQKEIDLITDISAQITRDEYLLLRGCLASDRQPESEMQKYDKATIILKKLHVKVKENMARIPIKVARDNGWEKDHPRYKPTKAGTKKPA